jgi:hypothetical protein
VAILFAIIKGNVYCLKWCATCLKFQNYPSVPRRIWVWNPWDSELQTEIHTSTNSYWNCKEGMLLLLQVIPAHPSWWWTMQARSGGMVLATISRRLKRCNPSVFSLQLTRLGTFWNYIFCWPHRSIGWDLRVKVSWCRELHMLLISLDPIISDYIKFPQKGVGWGLFTVLTCTHL